MTDREHLTAPVAAAIAVAGAALVVAAFLPWFDQGLGATMSLRELGDFLLRGRVGARGRWLGALIYAVPLGGCAAIIAAGLPRRRARVIAGVVAVVVAGLCIAAFATTGGQRDPAAGWFAAGSGTAALAIGAATARRRNVHESLD